MGGRAGESAAAGPARAPRVARYGLEATTLAELAGSDLGAVLPSTYAVGAHGRERWLSKTPFAAGFQGDSRQFNWLGCAGAWRSAQTADSRVANLQTCNSSLPRPSGLCEQPLEICGDSVERLSTWDLVLVHG